MSSRSAHPCHHRRDPRVRFYRKLKKYLKALFVLFALGIFLNDGFFEIFKIVALIGGISLGVKALKINGIPGTSGWLSDDYFDWVNRRYDDTPLNIPNDKKTNEGEDYDPLWKDKDLV